MGWGFGHYLVLQPYRQLWGGLLAGSGEKWQVGGDCGWGIVCQVVRISGSEGQQCAAGAGQGEMADETKKECQRDWGVGHCCYLSKGAFEQLDLDLMASKCERTAKLSIN